MKDFLSESLEYISEDLLAECDEYVAELLAKKEKRARRRKMLALWMRAGASAALVIAVVVTGFWAGWGKLNPKTPGLAYTVYDSFREAAMVIGENTLLSRLPAMETETVAVYDDSSADNTGTWADVVCRGLETNFTVVLETTLHERVLPSLSEVLYLDLFPRVQQGEARIGKTQVQFALFDQGMLDEDSSAYVAFFLFENRYYRFRYESKMSVAENASAAEAYLEQILITCEE